MTMSTDTILRLDAKLAWIARSGRTAMVCFVVRGQEEDLAALKTATDADLLLGVIIAREADSTAVTDQ